MTPAKGGPRSILSQGALLARKARRTRTRLSKERTARSSGSVPMTPAKGGPRSILSQGALLLARKKVAHRKYLLRVRPINNSINHPRANQMALDAHCARAVYMHTLSIIRGPINWHWMLTVCARCQYTTMNTVCGMCILYQSHPSQSHPQAQLPSEGPNDLPRCWWVAFLFN